jgi:ribose-phosphate pyrophosphokinase
MAKGREAISAKVVATMLQSLGVSRVIYFDVHAPAIQGFFDVPVDPLSALPVLASHFRKPEFKEAAIVSPDVGRAKFAGKYAESLGLPLVVMQKRRLSFSAAEVTHVVGDIQDKIPIIVDDVVAGGSVLTQAEALVKAGARPEVYFAISHGVLLPTAIELLKDPIVKQLVISDTICQPDAIRMNPKIQILSVSDVLAQAIWRIHVGESISSLIEKT